jgi:hypothetical protein
MLESSFQNLVAVDCLPDPLVVQLQRFTASLIEQGYADETVQWKVKRVTDFGQWLKQKGVAVADLDEVLCGGISQAPAPRAQGRFKNSPAVSRSAAKAERGSSSKSAL